MAITILDENDKKELQDQIDELKEGSGGIAEEADPTVPDWAKQPAKPEYTAEEVGADAEGTAASAVSSHNVSTASHNDIRLLITQLTNRLNAFLDIDDTTTDQLSEIIALITDNQDLIESITTNKVSVSDIINNLTTNVSNKPLSAAQGVALKALIDAITVPTKLSELTGDTTHRTVTDAEKTAWNAKSNFSGAYADLTGKPTIPTVPTKVSAFENDKGYITDTELDSAVDDALNEAKESGEFDGADGERGTGILKITTAPSAYTTATGGFTPAYRIALSTVLTQSKASKVLVGDTIAYNYYQYPVGYVDSSYVYVGARTSVRGATGAAGKDYSFDPTAYGLPLLYLNGDTTGMTKENAVTLSYVYGENSGSCTLKWQGSSSLAYDKKNYTIKLGTAIEVVDGWGAQQKYCLKANFIDHSHARNLVCAKLWGQVVKSRATANAKLNALPNGGAVDGFPVIIMLNGEFHGLYTWNIPKDGWMFGMGSGSQEAFVCADVPANDGAVAFKKLADLQNDFELEYSSYDASDWVLTSLNRLIQAVLDSNGTDLDTTLAKYIDWESAIDYYIFTVLICGLDNTKKNYILATYDGTKWFYSAYDMDSTFGVDWDGGSFQPADRRPTFETRTSDNLMALIWNYKRKALYDRTKEIMESVFSESNVAIEFSNFASKIPSPVLIEDVKKWSSIPSSAVNNTAQILNYYRMRFACAVNWLEEMLEGYGGDTESTATNLVPISTDANGAVYNGTGYKDGYRLSSSGAEKAQDPSTVTGYMPFAKTDICRITGVKFADYGESGSDGLVGGNGIGNLYSYLAIYDANKTLLSCVQCSKGAIEGIGVSATGWTYPYALDTDVIMIDFSGYTGGEMAYIRINAVGAGANMIVTKNEEISA